MTPGLLILYTFSPFCSDSLNASGSVWADTCRLSFTCGLTRFLSCSLILLSYLRLFLPCPHFHYCPTMRSFQPVSSILKLLAVLTVFSSSFLIGQIFQWLLRTFYMLQYRHLLSIFSHPKVYSAHSLQFPCVNSLRLFLHQCVQSWM